VLGAILAFTLEKPGDVINGLRLNSLGLVLMTAGLLVAAGWVAATWWEATGNRRAMQLATGVPAAQFPGGSASRTESLIKGIGGLIAVLFAIGAVVTLFVVTVSLTGNLTPETTIALATTAFGVISAVVGAYLGIKITSENNQQQAAATQALADKLTPNTDPNASPVPGSADEGLGDPVTDGDLVDPGGGESLEGAEPREDGARKV
jgi:peptidoglycan/LPS O-acetylase OafA/YrhL